MKETRRALRAGLRGMGLALTLALLLVIALTASAPASVDLTVCPPGTGAGQCSSPGGVTTDLASKRAYVADRGNNRINAFKVDEAGGKVEFLFAFGWGVDTGASAFETCNTASGCQAGIPGSGNGQFNNPRRVTVDNVSAIGPPKGCLYIYDSSNLRVQRFCPSGETMAFAGKTEAPIEFHDSENLIAVGPAGVVYVGDIINFNEKTIIKRFDPGLNPIDECELPHKDRLNSGLAVDSAGNMYTAFNIGGEILKFEWEEPVCKEVSAPYPPAPSTALAVDGSDALYAAEGSSSIERAYRVVTKFDSTGLLLRRYGYGSLLNTTIPGLSPLPTALGDIFASEAGSEGAAVKYLKEPPPGAVVADLFTPNPPGNVSTTLEAEVNPEGKATEYFFEYVDEASFQAEGGFASPKTKKTTTAALPGPPDFELHLASAPIGCSDPLSEAGHPGETAMETGECLFPSTVYRFRIQASNADGSGNTPFEGTFETDPPLEIEDSFASEVGTDSARLNARVDPLGIPTTGFFEYVDRETFEASGFAEAKQIPDVGGGAGPLDFGSGHGGITRSALVSLEPGTTYRFRFKASDPLIGVPITGEEVTFTTFKPEESESCPQNDAFRKGIAALLPDCRAYELVSPLDKDGGDIYSLIGIAEDLSQSSMDGTRFVYGSYRAFAGPESAPITSQYLAARKPGSWNSHFIFGPRERLNVPIVDGLANELRYLSPDLCQAWIETIADPTLAPAAQPKLTNLYRRLDRECGNEKWEALTTVPPPHGKFVNLQVQGTSADGSGAIYLAADNLTADAPDLGGSEFGLYYQAEGEGPPRYVCYLPSGVPIADSCAAGTRASGSGGDGGEQRNSSLIGAMSEDGKRVFWSTPAPIVGKGLARIFLREHPEQAQSKVNGEGKCTQATRACTIAVSAKGEELEGTEESQFWWAARDGSVAIYETGATLYRFEVATKTTTAIAGEVIGVMGASIDASRIYLASKEALTGPNLQGKSPVAGQANLYLAEGGGFHFLATLSPADLTSNIGSAVSVFPVRRSSRISPDGLHAAFVSQAPLTDYENTDAKSPELCSKGGRCDTEVFLYDAAANGAQGKLICASCNPSGGRPSGREIGTGLPKPWATAWLPVWKSSLYPGRVMSDDGSRLYFQAIDKLAPRDSNGAVDVYQWEAPGAGSCDEADPRYSELNEGCISLITSGQSAGNAELLDTSASGNDVFFATGAGLVEEDYGLVDVYDARVGGGLPSPPKPSPGCEGEACQGAAQAPSDPTPASASVNGAGNVVEGARPRCRKGKVRRRGRCVKSKRAHRRAKGDHRRAKR